MFKGKRLDVKNTKTSIVKWPVVLLESISSKIEYGYSDSSTSKNTGYKLLRITDIQNNNVDWEKVPFTSNAPKPGHQYDLLNGDLVFARTGATTGKSFLVSECPENSLFASYLIRIRPNSELVDSQYLKFFFQTPEYWSAISSDSSGATLPGVNSSKLKLLKIPLPPLPEQIAIANILSKAEALIAKRKESLSLLDAYLKSTFLEMFGDPVRNEKGWEVKRLGEACATITDGTHFSPPITKEGIPYVTAKHVRENKIDFFSNPWFISELDHKEIYKRCNPIKGDILYIKDGATTGYAAINKYDFQFSMLSSLALLKPDKIISNSEYICNWLNNKSVKRKILLGMSGGAIKRLTLAKINEILIPIPPLELQNQFAAIVEKVEVLKEKCQKSLGELENLYGALSQRAFRGELGKES